MVYEADPGPLLVQNSCLCAGFPKLNAIIKVKGLLVQNQNKGGGGTIHCILSDNYIISNNDFWILQLHFCLLSVQEL